jgi:hypothetical protein
MSGSSVTVYCAREVADGNSAALRTKIHAAANLGATRLIR